TFKDDAALTAHAQFYHRVYGAGGRSERVNVSFEEVKRRFQSFSPDPDGEKLLQRMSVAGIDVTVMCAMDNIDQTPADGEALKLNRSLAEFAERTKGKVLPLAGIDPRRREAPALYRRCIEEYGMRGLKWHADYGFYPNSEEAYALLKVAEQLGMPLLTHTGPLPGFASGLKPRSKYVDVGLLDEVAQDFPNLKIIAAHMGRFEWRRWAQMAQYRPNLYGDLAMWQVWAVVNYERFCRDLREILDIAGTESVLFGTDACSFSALVPNEQFVQILRDLPRKAPSGIKFTEEEVAAILGGNAQKVFGL
ncbi:MAG: amidohydrolase family protein, partial [Dehalococcoidia bacterium]|nr:amidohydrolase family protein [Dehalococcoidia bacterium]